jgi:hypothetical protein
VELPVEMESAAGNAVRPGDKQVQGEVERPGARRIAAGAEQGRASGRADKVIGRETRAQIRNNGPSRSLYERPDGQRQGSHGFAVEVTAWR